MTEKSNLLKPEEIRERAKASSENKIEQNQNTELYSKSNTVEINYETEGRFSIPDTLYFKPFTVEDVNNITLSKPEDIIENIIVSLNKLEASESPNFKTENMLLEEFLETLIGLKIKFNTPFHIHRWVCECQQDFDEKERQINESEIDLRELKYQTITEADSKIQQFSKEILDTMSEQEWNAYLQGKYAGTPGIDFNSLTKEDDVKSIKIKEPIKFAYDNILYEFSFPRLKHILRAHSIVKKEYAPKIKQVQNRKDANVPLAELKQKKEQEIERLSIERDKKIILYSRALTLNKVNGKELTEKEKIDTYSSLPTMAILEYIDFMENIKFGIQHEAELQCPICGNVSKRLLQRELNPIELLPLDASTSRKHRESARLNIYFG